MAKWSLEGLKYVVKNNPTTIWNCNACEVMYVGKAKKKLQERFKQHKVNVRIKRDRNDIYKQVQEKAHEIDLQGVKILEQEERKLEKEARRIKETIYKAVNCSSVLNKND